MGKVLVFRKKAVPLHPLSGTHLLSDKELRKQRVKKQIKFDFPSRERSQGRKALKSSLKRLHKTDTKVVQEAKY